MATSIHAQAGETPAAPRYIEGRWTYPSGEQMEAFYPSKAEGARDDVKATIDCEVISDGTLMNCRILSETPKGADVGYMTASLFINYCHVDPKSVPGGLQPGDRRKFTMLWPRI